MAKSMADEEPIGEAKNSPEKQAAKGMEVRQKVESRLAQWKEKMLKKNSVAKEYIKAWDKCKTAAKEGSARRQLLEKLTPVVEAAAIGRGLQLEATKWTLKGIHLVCGVVGLASFFGGPTAVAGVPIEAISIVSGIGAHTVELQDKMMAKSMGKIAERQGKTGFARRVDAKIDSILGWKGPEKPLVAPKEAGSINQVLFGEAKPAVTPVEVKPVIPKRV